MILRKILILMSLFSIFGCAKKSAPAYPQDTITAADGSPITVTFFQHASLAIDWLDRHIYIDPVGENIDWTKLPKADAIMITHSHYDHFDLSVVEVLRGKNCEIICDKTTAEAFEHDCTTMLPGDTAVPFEGLSIKAVRAYNITDGHTQFHPKEREDCGYVLTMGGTTLYVSGDTEDNDDVLALRDIDIAFLPVNQPYTMTIEQAVRAVKAIRPKIFYPYHYGQVEEKTDIYRLVRELAGVCEVRVRPME